MERKAICLKKVAVSLLLILSVCLIPAFTTSVSAEDVYTLHGVPSNVVIKVNGNITASDENGDITGLSASDSITVEPTEGYSITGIKVLFDGDPMVCLTVPEKIWDDGAGYYMELDRDATAYSKMVSQLFDKDFDSLQDFEYNIPDYDGYVIDRNNKLVQGSDFKYVQEGTYDVCIVVPDYSENIPNNYYSTSFGNVSGKIDDIEFKHGKKYVFTVTKYNDRNDRVDLTVTDQETEVTDNADGTYSFSIGNGDEYLTVEFLTVNVTYDANGGITGPDWIESRTAVCGLSMEGLVEVPSEDYVKAPAGMEFDGYLINGTFYPANSLISIVFEEDLVIKCMWKETGAGSDYSFSEGKDGNWVKGSAVPYKLTVKRNSNDEYTYDLFVKLEIDGSEVSSDCFGTAPGSLDITLNADYLEGLTEGSHQVSAVFSDGSAKTTLTIAAREPSSEPEEPEKTDDPNVIRENPDTGVTGFSGTIACISMLWMILLSRVIGFRKHD